MDTKITTDEYCELIIPGKVTINKIIDTKSVLAYHARKPLWPIHIIVIPKQHITSLLDFEKLDKQLIVDIMKAVTKVAQEISAKYGQCKVMTNVGEYQHIKHLHWHIYVENDI
jgi:histidine triad (HIT) family protein